MPDGSCARADSVLFVDGPGSSTSTCSDADPCSLVRALEVADATRNVIRLAPTTYTFTTTLEIDKQVTLFGRDANIDHNGTDGSTIRIGANGRVQLFYLTIMGADGPAGEGIEASDGSATLLVNRAHIRNNQSRGIRWNGGKLTIAASEFIENGGGGVFVGGGPFEVIGNLFFRNGRDASATGAISIQAGVAGRDRLEFNSFSKNISQDNQGTAIHCSGTLVAKNNIMSGNGTLTNNEQVGGTCTHAYSIARPGTVPTGTGNSSSDPMFVNTTTGDLHIQTESPAIGAADPSSDLSGVAAHDLDGQPRNSPADIGADEVP
jgi:hypothetical protein